MRDDREILLATKLYSEESRGRSWWHLLSTAAVTGGAIAGIATFDSLWVRIPLSVLLGLVLVRLFVIYHDVQHGTILRDSRVARAVMAVYGVLVLNPPSIWSRSHEHHHRHVGKIYGSSIGSYPLMTRTAWNASGRAKRFAYAMSRHPLTIGAGYVTIFLYGMCVRSFATDRRMHFDSAIAIAAHAVIVTLLAVFAPSLMLLLVLGPMTVACALGAYLFYAQHNYPGAQIRTREQWTYLSAALDSSSYIRMGPVMRWFTGNIGYHHVHHVNARIPFYRLPEAMAGIVELQKPVSTTIAPWHVWRCLRLKLWDVEQGRMTGFRRAT